MNMIKMKLMTWNKNMDLNRLYAQIVLRLYNMTRLHYTQGYYELTNKNGKKINIYLGKRQAQILFQIEKWLKRD